MITTKQEGGFSRSDIWMVIVILWSFRHVLHMQRLDVYGGKARMRFWPVRSIYWCLWVQLDHCLNDDRVERFERGLFGWFGLDLIVVGPTKAKNRVTWNWGLLYLVERVMGGLQPPMPMPHEYAWFFGTRLTDKGHGMTTGRESLKLHLRTWEERSRSNHGSSNTEDRNDDDWTSLSGNI